MPASSARGQLGSWRAATGRSALRRHAIMINFAMVKWVRPPPLARLHPYPPGLAARNPLTRQARLLAGVRPDGRPPHNRPRGRSAHDRRPWPLHATAHIVVESLAGRLHLGRTDRLAGLSSEAEQMSWPICISAPSLSTSPSGGRHLARVDPVPSAGSASAGADEHLQVFRSANGPRRSKTSCQRGWVGGRAVVRS